MNKNWYLMADVMAHTCNLSTKKTETGGLNFKVSLNYAGRPYLKKIRVGDVAQ
jgi:hypothetical protein